ncbi:hypothetical protein P43SY_001354 [Pythium insidiosum]|uniref:Unc-45 family protein n=1 Tax=Pythium insidiosum TaxID=114742 RepID=A0AAD5LPH7_PYTIN|nr:hypothetical protein P43SY_001354 [Pythium insidiosum]
MATRATLRAEGNALFSAKQFAAAVEKYSAGLALPPSADGADDAAQNVLLWSNRAACFLQLEQFDAALADCSAALDVEPQNEKARYRRAQAHVARGNFADAFRDVRLVLQLHPDNKAAAALARKIQDVVQRDVHGVRKALDAVVAGTDGASWRESVLPLRQATQDALQFLEMKCVQDLTSIPVEVDEKGGLLVLWRAVQRLLEHLEAIQDQENSDSDHKAVDSLLSHTISLLAIVASASPALAAKVYDHSVSSGAVFTPVLELLHAQTELQYSENKQSTARLLSLACRKHIVKLAAFIFKHLMLTSDDDTAIRSTLKGVLDGLRGQDIELQITALDGLLHFISTPTKEKEADIISQRKTRFATLAHEMGVFPLLHNTAARALHAGEVQPIDAPFDILLSRLPLVFTQCLAPLEKNESVLKKLVRDYCVAPVLAASPSDRRMLEQATASCLLLSALFLANAKLALWCVQQSANDGSAFLTKVHDFLVASNTFVDPRPIVRRLQEIWVDCVASVCGVENGTACVPSLLRVEIYKMLRAALDHDDLVLRASALSIQIKIAVVEKALDADSTDAQFLIDRIFEVLEQAHEYEKRAIERQLFWSGASPKERGIEALSYVITLTHVKNAFVKRPKAIESVFEVDFAAPNKETSTKTPSGSHAHAHVGYRSNVYYGIGYILHHVLTSEAALKKKQMEGMDITPEQYEELQKALKQKSTLDDGDTPEKVQSRVKYLVASSHVLTTLVQLLKYTTTRSQNVVEMATLSALHAAEVAEVRGKLVQSGVFQALIPLSLHTQPTGEAVKGKPKVHRPHAGTAISNAAGQAMAKILISTNPNLVPSSSLFSSIKSLLDLCKGDSQLLQFEALMALTNIASVSDETKNRIVTEPQSLSTLQYLQFSEHELVRRAATETICNLLPNEQIIEKIFLNDEKMRLWLALASVEEEAEDFETARAAAGALAMVSQVPQVSWLMMQQGALEAFVRVVEISTREETLHRALFALENMFLTLNETNEAEKADEKQTLLQGAEKHRSTLMKRMKDVLVGGNFSPAAQEAAKSCLGAFVQCVGKK